MKSFTATPSDIQRKHLLIDAEGLVLGRLAVIIADRLRGKHKPTYTPHMDCGDPVIVVNAEKVRISGNKRRDRMFYWHTGWPGGIKSRSWDDILQGKKPEMLLRKAVQRMIPRTPLGRQQMRGLRLYCGPDHPHAAQQPEKLDVAALSPKNARGSLRR